MDAVLAGLRLFDYVMSGQLIVTADALMLVTVLPTL